MVTSPQATALPSVVDQLPVTEVFDGILLIASYR